MKLTSEERDAIIIGLQMRICFIETGNPNLRARDVASGHKGEIRALSSEQMKLILLHEDLLRKVTNANVD